MSDSINPNCKSGAEYEEHIRTLLEVVGLEAYRTGKVDDGIDIIATYEVGIATYKYYIQCKYYNKPLGKAPIHEIFSGTHSRGNDGKPVVITNNIVTVDARKFAKRLGVEIIADAEWTEIRQVCKDNKVTNPNQHHGLMGILVGFAARDKDYIAKSIQDTEKVTELDDKEQLKLELINHFDEAEEHLKEAARLQQQSFQHSQMALIIQKRALLQNLEYG